MSFTVMICAPATERPASAGDEGRKAASDVRTAQMITFLKSGEQTRESVGKGAGTVSLQHSRISIRRCDL